MNNHLIELMFKTPVALTEDQVEDILEGKLKELGVVVTTGYDELTEEPMFGIVVNLNSAETLGTILNTATRLVVQHLEVAAVLVGANITVEPK